MKTEIHPKYSECVVTCACGSNVKVRSTKPKIVVDVCSKCHPFFTGQQRFVDTEGRVEAFQKRFETWKPGEGDGAKVGKKKKAALAKEAEKQKKEAAMVEAKKKALDDLAKERLAKETARVAREEARQKRRTGEAPPLMGGPTAPVPSGAGVVAVVATPAPAPASPAIPEASAAASTPTAPAAVAIAPSTGPAGGSEGR